MKPASVKEAARRHSRQSFRQFFAFAAGLFAIGLGALPVQAQVSSVKVFDGTVTRTVELQPFDGAKFLAGYSGELPPGNAAVVKALMEYPRDGTHTYWWPRRGESSYDGVTTDVVVDGKVILRGEEKARTYCCGLTLEVLYKAVGILGKTPESVAGDSASEFKRLWYCEKIGSPGPADALKSVNLGTELADSKAALPGDFVQLWRSDNSGHSVIFVDWARSTNGDIVGLHYWSTQTATNGIAFTAEVFGSGGKLVDRSRTSFARLEASLVR